MKLPLFLIALIVGTSITGCVVDETVTPQGTPAQPCTGGTCTTISGRLVTAGGRQGLPGDSVIVSWNYSPNFLTSITHIKARTLTDATGNYQASFLVSNDELANGRFKIAFAVDKEALYTTGQETLYLSDVKQATALTMPTYLVPRKATVNLTVINKSAAERQIYAGFVSPCGTELTFSRTMTSGGTSQPIKVQPGINNLTIPVVGGQPLLFRTIKQVNGNIVQTYDSLFLPPNGVGQLSVEY